MVTGVLNIRTAFYCAIHECKENRVLERYEFIEVNTLRTGDADLRFYITTVQDG